MIKPNKRQGKPPYKYKFADELQRFIRTLETNYKYSCLVTLTMRLIRSHGISTVCAQISRVCKIKLQKNYGIIALRLSMLVRHNILEYKLERDVAVKQIFDYIQNNYEGCLKRKYRKLIMASKDKQIQLLRKKFKNDLSTFRKAFVNFFCDQIQTTRILTQLYRLKSLDNPTKKQWKQANRLSKIICGTSEFGEDYKGEQLEITKPEKLQPSIKQINGVEKTKQAKVEAEQNLIKIQNIPQQKIVVPLIDQVKIKLENASQICQNKLTGKDGQKSEVQKISFIAPPIFFAPPFSPWRYFYGN